MALSARTAPSPCTTRPGARPVADPGRATLRRTGWSLPEEQAGSFSLGITSRTGWKTKKVIPGRATRWGPQTARGRESWPFPSPQEPKRPENRPA